MAATHTVGSVTVGRPKAKVSAPEGATTKATLRTSIDIALRVALVCAISAAYMTGHRNGPLRAQAATVFSDFKSMMSCPI